MSPDKGRPTDFQTKRVDLSKHGPPPGSAFAFFCGGGVDPVVSLGPKSRILCHQDHQGREGRQMLTGRPQPLAPPMSACASRK